MQNELKIAAIQTSLSWENPQVNLESFTKIIDNLNNDVDLVVLPEMFSTGFTMQPSIVAEKMDGNTVHWMKKTAVAKNIAIVGSLVIEEENNYYNRAIFVHPTGEVETYNKRHSFSLAGEDKEYTSGNEKSIVAYKGWKICPLICYDLRFPAWSRFNDDYDLLLYMANWPKPRIFAWDTLLKARAIENMSYCIGVNRIGEDKNGYQYNGHTAAYDFLGAEVSNTVEGNEEVLYCVLSKTLQENIRKKLNFLNDRDKFTLQ